MIFMNKKDSASISIMKIIGVSLIFILLFGVSVMATEIDIRSVEITMKNDSCNNKNKCCRNISRQ